MNWKDIIKEMPKLLEKLQQAPLAKFSDAQKLYCFNGGVYAFYEKDKPLYIKQTIGNVAANIIAQGKPDSNYSQAEFAFILAKTRAMQRHLNVVKTCRSLERDKKFNSIFTQQKKRIKNMKVKAIQISDPQVRTIFEIYAAKMLDTPFNA